MIDFQDVSLVDYTIVVTGLPTRRQQHAFCHKVEMVLNGAMRLASGTLLATPASNLPVLSGVPPALLRRDGQTIKLAMKHGEDNSLVPAPFCPRKATSL